MQGKKVWLFLLFTLVVEASISKSAVCAVPESIASEITPLFDAAIVYTQMKVKVATFKDNKQTLEALTQKHVKFALVRSDVLYALTQEILHWPKLKSSYITLSTLPVSAALYYVQSASLYDIDLVHLKDKVVSVGRMGEVNGYLFKSLLKRYGLRHAVQYKSLDYKHSLQAIDENTMDGFFGFLPTHFENNNYNFQRLFSDESMAYVKAQDLYSVDYEGVSVSYTLVASRDASDEEIENVIYRLEEKKMFMPQTDEKFGPVNRYVLEHLAQIQKALDAQAVEENREEVQNKVLSKSCLDYHYGFLDLLRRKPALKKRVRLLKNRGLTAYKNGKKELKKIEKILLDIDANKQACDLLFLKQKKTDFMKIENKIK